MAYVLSHEAHVWQFTQNLSLLPFYPGTSRGGRPILVDQYTYGEAVRSVMKRQVEVRCPRGPKALAPSTFLYINR